MSRYDNFKPWGVVYAQFSTRSSRISSINTIWTAKGFCLEDFDSHWWLLRPARQEEKPEAFTSFVKKIRLIREEFEEGTLYRQQVILDHLDVLSSAEVFNPFIRNGRGRPVGALGNQSFGNQLIRSTQRHPSPFEHVKNSLRPVRRFGNCGVEGHNRRICQQPLPTSGGTALVPSNDLGAEDD